MISKSKAQAFTETFKFKNSFKIWKFNYQERKKYRNPLVASEESVYPMTKTSKIFFFKLLNSTVNDQRKEIGRNSHSEIGRNSHSEIGRNSHSEIGRNSHSES